MQTAASKRKSWLHWMKLWRSNSYLTKAPEIDIILVLKKLFLLDSHVAMASRNEAFVMPEFKLNISLSLRLKKNRSSCSRVFCKKGVLKNFAKFTGKPLCQSRFFNRVTGHFMKKETGTGFFLRILQNFQGRLFYGTPPVATSRRNSF